MNFKIFLDHTNRQIDDCLRPRRPRRPQRHRLSHRLVFHQWPFPFVTRNYHHQHLNLHEGEHLILTAQAVHHWIPFVNN